MGSCEIPPTVDEPSRVSDIEQRLCSKFTEKPDSEQQSSLELGYILGNSNVDYTNVPDGCPGLSRNDNVGCVCSGDVMETAIDNRDGVVVERENAVISVSDKMLDDECRVSGVCLSESRGESDICNLEADGLCSKKEWSRGEDGSVNSFDGCETPLGVIPVTSLLKNCVKHDEQKHDKAINVPSVEEAVEGKSDVLALTETDTSDQISSSQGCEMPFELIPMTGSSRNFVQGDEKKDEGSISGFSAGGVLDVMEERSDDLVGIETNLQDQTLSSMSCKMPSELIVMTCLPQNFVQKDERRDDNSISVPFVESVVEERSELLVGIEKNTPDQNLPSWRCEMQSELISMTSLSRGCVKENEQKDDNSISDPFAEEFVEVMQENNDVLARIKTNKIDQTSPSQVCVTPLELIPVIVSPANCVQQGGWKDDKSINGPSAEGVMEVTEEQSEVLAGIETDTCNQILPSQGSELPSELTHMTGQQNEMNGTESIRDPVMYGKDVASLGLEADMSNHISVSQGGEMPSNLLHAGDSVNSCDGQNYQKDDKSISDLSVERITEVVETKSDSDSCIQVLPSWGCQRTLDNLHMADSLSNCVQQNEKRNDKSVDGSSMESVTEVVEEGDLTTDIKVEFCTQILPTEKNAFNLKEGSFTIAPECHIEKSVSLQSCQPFVAEENGSKRLDAPDPCRKGVFDSVNSSSAIDCSGLTENEGNNTETKFPDIVLSSSRRSSRISKSSRKNQTKRATRKCRNTAKVPPPRGSIEIIFKAARKRRSCFSKPARSSIWGLPGNIMQFFKQSDELWSNQVQNKESSKARSGRGSAKRNKNRAGGSSRGSGRKYQASTSCLRLKVKLGKEDGQSSLNIMVPEVVDASVSASAIISDYGSESYQGTSLEFPKIANGVEDRLGEEGAGRQFQCFDKNPEKAKSCPYASAMDENFTNKDLKGTVISEKSAGDAADDYLVIPSHTVVEALGGATESRYVDPGTSPDSEVINLLPDAQVGARHQEEMHDAVLTSSEPFAALGDVDISKKGKKKDNLSCANNCILEVRAPGVTRINKAKQSKTCGYRQKMGDGFYSIETPNSFNSAIASSKLLSCKEFPSEPLPLERETEPGVSSEALIVESGTEAEICGSLDIGLSLSESQNFKNLPPSTKSKGRRLPKSSKSDEVCKGRSKVSDSARSRRDNACRQRGNQRKSDNKSKGKEKGVSDQVVYKMEGHPETGNHIANDIGKNNTGDSIASTGVANLDIVSGAVVEPYLPPDNAWVRCDDCHKWRRISVALADSIAGNCRWICEDNKDEAFADCSIPQEKSNADINAELGFSDTSCEEDASDVPLNYEGSEKGLECRDSTVPQRSFFTRIDTNEFLHRSRKTQTIDEIMVCHCKQSLDGRLGCGDECLNRMLNIECVQGTCPCGDLCSNQQFQKRKYAKMMWTRCGKKGYGLALEENILKGQFLIEYVGEVLDMHAYEARQKEYASNGHKHFYFMTLNGSEVIDASAKGNLGRFINHSCDPNCRTEKWVVNGEICIGLFALRDIKEGEELTFDYNYVRVFGAAAKKCYCDAPQCRGYIGGDPQNTEVIVQGDSDDEYPEPVMLEDGETWDGLDNMISRTSSFDVAKRKIAESMLKDMNRMDNATTAVGQLESTTEIEDSMNQSASAVSQLVSSSELEDSKGKYPSSFQPVEISLQTDDVTSKPISSAQQDISMEEENTDKTFCSIQTSDTSSPATKLTKSLSDGIDVKRKSKSDTVEDKRGSSKSRTLMKTPRSSGSVKKGKPNSSLLNGNKVKMMAEKSQVPSVRPKKLMEGSSNDRFEAVQEKLNELLDAEGGISKRKDAPKGYLKLLLLTAASGGSGNGEAIQSNRDLSMILDALLKTKSRVVLIDIINKNGLRMLHNIMKQYRRDFKKIPILRKLLKVLEYLAVREILTLEHINGGPPCPGMESFRESILSLTEHDDKQVHQIARNFRDRWIPRPVRKPSYMDRDDGRMEFHRGLNCNRVSASHNHWRDQSVRPTEAIDCVKQSELGMTSGDAVLLEGSSAPCIGGCQTNGTKIRKRKSRWDQPAETDRDSRLLQHKEQKIESRLLQQLESSALAEIGGVALDHVKKVSREDSNCLDSVHEHCQQAKAISTDDERQNIHEDVPPGFSSPLGRSMFSSSASSTATYLPQQNVCHLKCPYDVVIAHPQRKFISCLPVAYGIPLPIMQHFGSPKAETVESWLVAPGMPFHPFPPLPPFPRDKKDTPPCAVNCMTINEAAEEKQRDGYGPGTCYPDENNPSTACTSQLDVDGPDADIPQMFKRARGSSHDLGRRYFRQEKCRGPPWLWKRNGRGHMGNNSKVGTCSVDVGNVTNELSSYSSQDVNYRVDKAGNNFCQHPQHQNLH